MPGRARVEEEKEEEDNGGRGEPYVQLNKDDGRLVGAIKADVGRSNVPDDDGVVVVVVVVVEEEERDARAVDARGG